MCLLTHIQYLCDGCAELTPGTRFGPQLFSAGGGERVVSRPPIVLGDSPTGLDPSPALESVQSRVQRALLDLKNIARDLLNAFGDGPAMLGLKRKRLEDEEV